MRKVIEIFKDDKYSITLANDGWKAAVVQVCMFTQQTQIKESGPVETRTPQLVWQKSVEMVRYEPKGNVVPVSMEDFKKNVVLAVAEAQNQYAQLLVVEQMFDGVANDFLSQQKNGTSQK